MDSPARPADRTHLADLVAATAPRVPDHPAVVDVTAPTTLTWAELDAAGSAEADRLRAHGVGLGDRVAIRLPNGAGYCVALLGALRAGAIAVPCGPRVPRPGAGRPARRLPAGGAGRRGRHPTAPARPAAGPLLGRPIWARGPSRCRPGWAAVSTSRC